jgi:HSP20 family protein
MCFNVSPRLVNTPGLIRFTSPAKAYSFDIIEECELNVSEREQYGEKLHMVLIRWQPHQEMTSLRRQLDKMFDELANVNPKSQMTWKPAVELQDTEDSIILRAEIPGVEGKDLDIQVTREAVAISGEHRYEKKAEANGHFRTEFRYGKFQRAIALPVAVQNDQVQAEFKNGILTLTLPKVAEARNKVVKVNLADTTPATAEVAAEPTVAATQDAEPAI